MKNVIYHIRCIANGAIYIGSARDFNQRTKSHLAPLRSGKHPNRHILSAFVKHGEESFQFVVVDQVDSPEKLIEAEQRHIDRAKQDGIRLMNICPKAGSRLGSKETEESKERRRLMSIGRKHTPESINLMRQKAQARGNNGATPSLAARKACSDRTKGKPQPKHLVGLLIGNRYAVGNKYRLGIKHTPEALKKMSDARLGEKPSAEIIEKRARALREWWLTHDVSEETRAKIVAHKRAYWAAKRAAKRTDTQTELF